ncbi:MAG: 1-deoxy-D-xylulose-5-phosphate synthase [Firmicutes bacterium]|nr:1-deoxy-D-xylulose-5-phosphate synthase [Bacillota bacterium]MCL1953550.1 1-deoxy-D-xylulose-5-phosphate synthase [Bacillota bacterium]
MDIKSKSIQELEQLCIEIRRHIIDNVYANGGHLSSNLGVVELTVAMHFVFDFYKDRLLFDVGHQCYAHKILTDRDLSNLRSDNGVTGFPNPMESDADVFCVGHGTTSISQAVGLARARDIVGQDYNILALIGDGAFGGGMAFEALNDLGECKKKVIIVLNDNEMSISPNVGAMSIHFSKLGQSKNFATFKNNIKRGFQVLPVVGDKIVKLAQKAEKTISDEFSNNIIRAMGIKYFGPYDGHDLANNIQLFKLLSNENGPVLIHFLTQKGKGVVSAQNDPENFHGVAAKNPKILIRDYETEKVDMLSVSDNSKPSLLFADYMSEALIELAETDKRVVAITAGMTGGTGLVKFGEKFGNRLIDVGMAEQHATTMASALSKGGCKPFFAVYSTFLQRAFDQVIHDVSINGMSVVFLIDRAGVNGADGVTHQGVYDIAYLSQIPNMTIMSPKDGQELKSMIKFAYTCPNSIAIRYPKNFGKVYNTNHEINYSWEQIRQENNSIVVIATGNRMLDIAMQVQDVDIVYATFIKPLDYSLLDKIASKYKLVITLEDAIKIGGMGQQIACYLQSIDNAPKCVVFGHGDSHIFSLDQKSVFASSGIDVVGVQSVVDRFKNS